MLNLLWHPSPRELLCLERYRGFDMCPRARELRWSGIDGFRVLWPLTSLLRAGKIQATSKGQTIDSATGIEARDTFSNERLMIVVRTFRVNLHAIAQLADMFVKRGFEPAVAQAATTEPLRRKSEHFLYDCGRINIRSTEHFERSRRAAARDPPDAPRHLGGGPAGEGHQQDLAGIGTIDDQVGHPVRQGVGLAGPGAGDDERGLQTCGDG
jgi:hypothetical protein